MGDRAVITTKEEDLALYLHWMGGRDTVEPLLKYCELQGYRPPSDDYYGWARMAQVMGNYFGGTLSVGINTFDRLGNQGDHGIYIIDGWKIVNRIGSCFAKNHGEESSKRHDFDEPVTPEVMHAMLHEFDMAMPYHLRLGEYLDSVEIPTSEVRLGDIAWWNECGMRKKAYVVLGFGESSKVGDDLEGVPFVRRDGHGGDYSLNVCNYIKDETCRIKPRD